MLGWTLAALFAGCNIELPDPRNCPTRQVYFADPDGDGFGDPDQMFVGCSAPEGWVLQLAPEDSATPTTPTDSAFPTGDTSVDPSPTGGTAMTADTVGAMSGTTGDTGVPDTSDTADTGA